MRTSHYEKNLEFIKNTNPKLAEKIDCIDINESLFDVFPVQENNGYTCRVSNNINEYKFLLHSMVNPIDEAIDQTNDLEGLDRNYFLVVIGFGFGYHIRELLKKKLNRGIVLIVEPRLDILKMAMTNMDLSDILSYRNLYILGYDENFKEESYEYFLTRIAFVKNPIIFQLDSYDNILSGIKLKDIRTTIVEMIWYSRLAVGDSPSDTLVGILNTFNNIKYLLNTFNFLELKDKYKNVPAVIVSAGPSLDKNFKLLKEVQGKFLIIAAETINEKLLKSGIKADIVSVLERGINVYDSYFKDKEFDEKTVLFGQALIEHEIFDDFKGKNVTCIKGTTLFDKWVSELLGGFNTFNSGSSVATMNYSIAQILGCNPIILIGQDLSYADDGKSHSKDTFYENETAEEHMNENALRPMVIKGNYKDFVQSNDIWYQFLRWFEIAITTTEAEVYNATEGGAFIKGTKLATLRELIDKYCVNKGDIPKIYDLILEVNTDEKVKRIEGFIKGVNLEIDKMKTLESVFIETLKTCSVVLNNKNVTDSEIITSFNKINTLKLNFDEYSKIFAFIIQAPRVASVHDDLEIVSINSIKEFNKWIKKQEEFFSDMLRILKLIINTFTLGNKMALAQKYYQDINFIDTNEIVTKIGDVK